LEIYFFKILSGSTSSVVTIHFQRFGQCLAEIREQLVAGRSL